MDLDQSFLSELPLQHRQKVCKQIRQKQVYDTCFTRVQDQRGFQGFTNGLERM
ncbi:hypothetical protein DPMN_131852 [Dreissena polymorpha]|uniref:Uncharacterized protein n=1 Tax=Dreissena polymorpha TaxID=45954 RepID=A0A9D4JD74_DREPO|nr:hypothetical protein DPMN_131852 [Dreissena polymorpha]